MYLLNKVYYYQGHPRRDGKAAARGAAIHPQDVAHDALAGPLPHHHEDYCSVPAGDLLAGFGAQHLLPEARLPDAPQSPPRVREDLATGGHLRTKYQVS